MTAFSTVTPTSTPLNPNQHVNYSLGMVLGVDDFGQEFAYHSGRSKLLARDLIGAGTIRGLSVSISADGTEVIVAPGIALTPRGEFVKVPSAQCAVLSDWVTSHAVAIALRLGGSPAAPPASGTLTLYVVLRFKPCLTDPVPIPGEPCRSEADAMAPSRVTDGFQLDLLLSPPAPTEQAGMRAVLAWLARVPVVASSGTATPAAPEALLTALLNTFGPLSPLASPAGTYPPPPATLTFGAATAATMYRLALQFYATDLRDRIAESIVGSAPGALGVDAVPAETGILLGTVYLPVQQTLTGAWTAGTATLDPSPTRPFLLPLDLLQEAGLLAAGLAASSSVDSHSYRVAAAGIVSVIKPGDPASDPASTLLPNLQALWSTSVLGDVLVSFPDNPAATTQYVIKVQPLVGAAPAALVGLVLNTISTTPPGFIAHVSLNGGEPTTQAQLDALNLKLVVEVSAFVS